MVEARQTAVVLRRRARTRAARAVAEQPAALVVEGARLELELRAAEQRRRRVASSERYTCTLSGIESRDDRIVGVAEIRHVAADVHDAREEVEHGFEALPVLPSEVASVGARHEAGHDSSMSATSW